MANEVELITFANKTVSPVYDAIIQELYTDGGGVITGCTVTIKDANHLHITEGYGVLCGREFKIVASDIPVQLSSSGNLNGRLYLHMDLSLATDPITLLVETGSTLTPVQQDDNVNTTNGVYEVNLATFTVGTSAISNLQDVAPQAVKIPEALNTLNSNIADVKETVTANELGTYVNISSYTSYWYTCPSDGYIHIRCNTAGTTMQAQITGPSGGVDLYLKAIGASGGVFDSISVRKGMKVKMIKTGTGDAYGYFVPLE